MEIDVGFLGDAPDFFERLNRAELVVGVHDGDKRGFRAQSAAKITEVDQAVSVDAQVGDGGTFFFEGLAGVENGFVFG